MEQILASLGVDPARAQEHEVGGESVILVKCDGDGPQMWRRARAALPDHYPALILHDDDIALDRTAFKDVAPADVLGRATAVDVDRRIADISAERMPGNLGTGEEGYFLDGYDIEGYGPPSFLAILPRPEPWAVFAYLVCFWTVLGSDEPELVVAAAHAWHDRYGAEPTVVGLATGFLVPRPPTGLADAERLAAEHTFFAGLTARTTQRAYARALLQLDHWTLYDRP